MRIGVSGDAGSFSEQASLKYVAANAIAEYSLNYLIDMDGVLAALARAEIDIGVFPFLNSTSGVVWPAFCAMGKYNFVPITEIQLTIEQCLIAKRTTTLAEIQELYSYPPAFEQCKIFIQRYGFKLVNWGDTARAARDLAAGLLPAHAAVVGSAAAAKHYGLTLLQAGIQDLQENITHFMVVKPYE